MITTAVRPFFLTSIGKKYLMALTGLIWAGFVFAHMAGNLLLLVSADAYNAYGHAITSGYFIYMAEAVLLAALIVHVFCAMALTLENKKARGSGYAMTPNGEKGASLASRTMAIHGVIILIFLISHLATFKYGTYYETTVGGVVMRDLHRLIVEIFRQPGYVGWYLFSLCLLGVHLSHGVGSLFQSFGILTNRLAPVIDKLKWIYAVIVAGGFIIQPLYVYFIAR